MGCRHGPGYVRCHMHSKYGEKAFHKNGLLKVQMLRREKDYQMRHHPENVYMVRALTEAINFKSKR